MTYLSIKSQNRDKAQKLQQEKQEIVENHDQQHPERINYVKEEYHIAN